MPHLADQFSNKPCSRKHKEKYLAHDKSTYCFCCPYWFSAQEITIYVTDLNAFDGVTVINVLKKPHSKANYLRYWIWSKTYMLFID